MNQKYFLIVFVSLYFLSSAFAATTLNKGFTLGDWLNQDEAYYIQTTRYTQEEFEGLKALGCDHVRIPVNFITSHFSSPDYQISDIQLSCLDKAISWAESAGLKVVIVNTAGDIANANWESIADQLGTAWKYIATRYAAKGDVVAYEILDGPEDAIDAANWNAAADAIVKAIREVDTNHTIIIGAIDSYSIDQVTALAKNADENILYTFEFFDPPLFTSQGTSYRDTTFNTIDVPFPQDAGSMPSMDAGDAGTAAEAAYNAYSTQGTVDWVKQRLDLAINFATTKGVQVYCSSFGTTSGTNYNSGKGMGWYVIEKYRVAWLEAVRTYLEEKNVGWCLSGYRGNFGPFFDYNQDPDLWMQFSAFPYDLNGQIVEALGLTTPEITMYNPDPLEEGFMIFDEEITPWAQVGWWLGDGEPDFFVQDDPISGKYCLGIFYPGQWNAVDFFFPLFLDLSILAEDGYLLDFWIRCDDETGHIEARFEDTNEDLEDRPWRMNYHVDNTVVPFDGDWQRVTIALTAMVDQGAWDSDDRTWYNGGLGMPDWSVVQRLQFVSETAEQPDTEIYLDRIRIVSPTAVDNLKTDQPQAFKLFANYPNPFNPTTNIEFSLDKTGETSLQIYNVRGELVRTLVNGRLSAGAHVV
ncbi:cellulase family glycosylhydrolase, partial [candidate division KSB1 bacterium]|nr:cellulase family glycosylhydrolase [candidate division KSB1 bacterium]